MPALIPFEVGVHNFRFRPILGRLRGSNLTPAMGG
jgi:hypothetical protein